MTKLKKIMQSMTVGNNSANEFLSLISRAKVIYDTNKSYVMQVAIPLWSFNGATFV